MKFWNIIGSSCKWKQRKYNGRRKSERRRKKEGDRRSHSIVCFQLNLYLQMVARLINHYYIRMGYFKWVDIVIKLDVMNNVFIHFNAMRSKGIYVKFFKSIANHMLCNITYAQCSMRDWNWNWNFFQNGWTI